jgi:hypothetical protein
MSNADQKTPFVIPSNARCVGCGYSLYQLTSERCPECGRAFDPTDPVSMGLVKRWFEPILAFLRRPPSRFSAIWPYIALVLFIVAATVPDCYLVARAIGSVILAAQPVGFVLTTMAGRGSMPSNSDQRSRHRYRNVLLAGWTIAAAAWALITYVPIVGIVLFTLYRSDLDDLEKHVPPTPVNYRSFGDARLGPYSPFVGRHPEYLRVIPFETYYPENWLPFIDRVHRVEFLCLDDPTHDYKHDPDFQPGYSDLWHLRGNWYVTLP